MTKKSTIALLALLLFAIVLYAALIGMPQGAF